MHRTRCALVVSGLVAVCGCGGQASAVSPSVPLEVLSLRLETAHFRVWANHATATTTTQIAERLETEFPRLSADLGVADLPVTTVEVWSDTESFHADMAASIGRRVVGATGYVVGPTNVTILDGANAAGRTTHELAHCVSLRVNPRLGNNPRWLWEAVALYENGERVDPRTLPYMQNGNYPTLAQLSGDYASSLQIYDVGFVLGEFIVATWGRDGLIRLIQANGDLSGTVGLTAAEFEQRWYAFVTEKYLREQPVVEVAAQHRGRRCAQPARRDD